MRPFVLRPSVEDERWNVLAATVADQRAFFSMKDQSAGASADWGAGVLTYALIEGLVGVADADGNYESATIGPKRRVRVLLPTGTTPGSLDVNGEQSDYETQAV